MNDYFPRKEWWVSLARAAQDNDAKYFINTLGSDYWAWGASGVIELVVMALGGGPRAAGWIRKQELEEIMLKDRCWGIKTVLVDRCWLPLAIRKIWEKGVAKLLKDPVMNGAAQKICATKTYCITRLKWLHNVKPITRENCLANDGEILRSAALPKQKYLIRACGLSPSDFASVGLRFPVAN